MRHRLHTFTAKPGGQRNDIFEFRGGSVWDVNARARHDHVGESLDTRCLGNRRFDRVVSDEILNGKLVHRI